MTFYAIFMMIIKGVLTSLFISIALFVIRFLYKKWHHQKLVNDTLFFVQSFYLCMLLYVMIFRGGLFQNEQHYMNYVPFYTLIESSLYQASILGKESAMIMFLYNVIGNVLCFVPLGIFLSSYLKDKNLFVIFVYVMMVSASIEVLQYLFYTGISDIDDIIFNTLGGLLGYCIYQMINREMVINYDN